MPSPENLLAGSRAKPAVADHPVLELIQMRWSPRAFAAQAITDADLHTLFEAARWAASASNEQPWSFVVARRSDAAGFQRILDCLSASNQVWAKEAALLMVTATRIRSMLRDADNPSAAYDLGQAVATLALQATAMGIAIHQMGGFDRAKAQQALGIPATHQPLTAIAVGYPGDPALLNDNLRTREAAPRIRKPLGDFVFEGTWQSPLMSLSVTGVTD